MNFDDLRRLTLAVGARYAPLSQKSLQGGTAMTIRKTLVLGAAVAAAIAFAQSSPLGVAGAGEEAAVTSGLPAPETRSDYTTLAADYDEMAKAARAEAEKHRKMAASARGGMKAAYQEKMKQHCDGIVELQEKLAAEYSGLAETYREQAAEMGD